MNALTLPQKLRAHAKLWQNVVRRGECWIYTGRVLPTGYGGINIGPRATTAHRLAYMTVKGTIPEKYDVDHTCHDPRTCAGGWGCPHRACVNPAHLEAVTRHDNIMRGCGPGVTRKWRAAVTNCPQGHAYDEKNTYFHITSGERSCRRCACLRARENRAMKKAQENSVHLITVPVADADLI